MAGRRNICADARALDRREEALDRAEQALAARRRKAEERCAQKQATLIRKQAQARERVLARQAKEHAKAGDICGRPRRVARKTAQPAVTDHPRSLTQALAERGIRHEPGGRGLYRRRWFNAAGEHLGDFSAAEGWAALELELLDEAGRMTAEQRKFLGEVVAGTADRSRPPTPRAKPTALAPISTEDLPRDLLQQAYRNTSFSSDRRAEGERRAYVAQMTRIREAVLANGGDLEAFEAYRVGWLKRRRELYARHSGLASAMIVGPARFPAARQRKARDLYHRKLTAFLDWDEKQQRKLLGRAPAVIRSTDVEAIPKLRAKLDEVQGARELAKEANKILRRRISDEEKRAGIEGLGYSADVARRAVSSGIGQVGRPGFHLRNMASEVKRLERRIAEIEAHHEARDSGTFAPFERDGWSVTMDADRVRVRGPKPEAPDARKAQYRRFKARGFVWSRKNSAYQRQANANAWAAARELVDEIVGGA